MRRNSAKSGIVMQKWIRSFRTSATASEALLNGSLLISAAFEIKSIGALPTEFERHCHGKSAERMKRG
jgi:hypothetical protein